MTLRVKDITSNGNSTLLKCYFYFIGIFLSLWGLEARGQDIPFSAQSSALGGAKAALSEGLIPDGNMASLALRKEGCALISYRGEFSLAQLSHKGISLSVPTGENQGLAASYVHFGTVDYGEHLLQLGYGIKVSPQWALGAEIGYRQNSSSEATFHSQKAIGFGLGSLYSINKEWAIGTLFKGTSGSMNGDGFFTDISIGAQYHIDERLMMVMDVENYSFKKTIIRSGLEYCCFEGFSLRIGISSNPMSFSFGLGYEIRQLSIHAAIITHNRLGYTEHITLGYRF